MPEAHFLFEFQEVEGLAAESLRVHWRVHLRSHGWSLLSGFTSGTLNHHSERFIDLQLEFTELMNPPELVLECWKLDENGQAFPGFVFCFDF